MIQQSLTNICNFSSIYECICIKDITFLLNLITICRRVLFVQVMQVEMSYYVKILGYGEKLFE
jgi:hypothetical protein